MILTTFRAQCGYHKLHTWLSLTRMNYPSDLRFSQHFGSEKCVLYLGGTFY